MGVEQFWNSFISDIKLDIKRIKNKVVKGKIKRRDKDEIQEDLTTYSEQKATICIIKRYKEL